ncbi:MAG: TonB-dependent receptor [Bacteroidales bacterium]
MKAKNLTLMISVFVFVQVIKSQEITQTIRGTLKDEDGKSPLTGATVIIPGTNPVKGAITDSNGKFRFDNIPVGRIDIEISYVGYENKYVSNILVNSGKEVMLDIEMRESVLNMDEVVITARQNKGEVLNEMAMISSRTFSVEETNRYAGSFQDPSRMVSAFAGVSSNPEGNNDIIVRGNSPKGILWRLDGIEIPNPNHFSNEGATGGSISALNSDLLSNSDFYTGAFAPEYGDVFSGVFDIHMRSGNNEKREYSIGVGALGTDITLEGPFRNNYGGSYLVNYRYSSLAMLSDAGIVDFDGVPKYQDAAFKLLIPTKKTGTFSLFGLGGISHILTLEEDNEGNIIEEGDFGSKLGMIGLNHTLPFNSNNFMKVSLSVAGNNSGYKEYESDSADIMQFNFEGLWAKSSFRSALMFSSKINARNRLVSGIKFSRNFYDLYEYYMDEDFDRWVYGLDLNRHADILQGYVSWKFRMTDNLTFVSGFHGIYFSVNDDYNLEPRLGLKWQVSPKHSVNLGYGVHSKAESIITYYTIINNAESRPVTPNSNLGLAKSQHFVLGYDYRFSKNLNARVELYYQDIFNVPVENIDTSSFTLLNSDEGYINKALINKGTGYNYGIEFTLEKYFTNQYYFLFTTSVYDSKYKALDGVLRNTRYNGNYAFNLLAGKEFNLGNGKSKKVLGVNAKIFYSGGRRYIPVDIEESRKKDETVYDYSKAWDKRLDDIFQLNLSISYRINRPKAGHEILLDIANVTGAQGKTWEFYNELTNKLDYDKQVFMIPNIMYRVHF